MVIGHLNRSEWTSYERGMKMQIEVPDEVVTVLRDALGPVIERLIDERVQQRRPLLLSVTEVANELSCSRASIYGLIHGGHLEAVCTGRTYRVATTTLHEYIEELTKPTREREVVSRTGVRAGVARRVASANRSRPRQLPSTSVLAATRPPRSPRPKRQKMSKEEVADRRSTVVEFAESWHGLESATVLIQRSGIALTVGSDGQSTFRYGDLVEWMENNETEFHRWLEEFDPVLKGSSGRGEDGDR
jgi:excisionase family DNA binding protein